jgi:Flp pilus assembly protein TadD/cell division septation protein DedD
MIAVMHSSGPAGRSLRATRSPDIAHRLTATPHRGGPAQTLLLAALLLLAACSNGTDAVPSLASRPDQLLGDKSPATILRIADATRAGGDPASAIGLYRRAHELAPKDATPLVRLGATFAEMHAYTEAVASYRQAKVLAPQNLEIERGLGAVLLALGEPELALTELAAALERQKDDPRLFSLVGVAYDQIGRHDIAQQTYAAGLRAAPNYQPLRNNLGLSQALSGDFADAEATLTDAAAGPAATPRTRQNLALVYGLAGDTEKAAAAARGDLDEASVKNNLAYYALLRGMDDRTRAAAIIGARLPVGGAQIPEARAASTQRAETPEEAAPERSPERPKIETAPLTLPAAPPAPRMAGSGQPARQTASPAKPPKLRAPGSAIALSAPTPSAEPLPTAPAEEAAAPELTTPELAAGAATQADPEHDRPIDPVRPPQRSAFLVQVGAFRDAERAEKLCGELVAKGYELAVAMQPGKTTHHDWYVCRSTAATDHALASALAARLREDEKTSALLIPSPPLVTQN